MPVGRRWLALSAVLGLVACGLVLLSGYMFKTRCVGPHYNAAGRSIPDYTIRINRDLCYSDIQQLWLGREIDQHVFPYVHGYLAPDNRLQGGAIEYPVLTGLAMWAAAIGVHTDGTYLAHGALLLAPFGLITALLLFRMAGRRAWWYALAPPLFTYAFLSFDLIPVAVTTAGFAIMVLPRSWSARRRAIAAAIVFGIGAAVKFYPLMFVAPVALWLATGESGDRPDEVRRRSDPAGAAWVCLAGVGTVVAVNLPFAVAGFRGWWASFQFQWQRPIESSTNSIWFWATRPHSEVANTGLQHTLGTVSTLATATGMIAVLVAGWILGRGRGYPWLPVSAALLCAYLLLNKVDSPQYALWLLPFFVLLRIRAGWIISYFLADLAVGIGWLTWQYQLQMDRPSGVYNGLPAQLVMIGVWGRAALLVGLAVAFLGARPAVAPFWEMLAGANTDGGGRTDRPGNLDDDRWAAAVVPADTAGPAGTVVPAAGRMEVPTPNEDGFWPRASTEDVRGAGW
jgi:hypothetical protein